jgi:hypothetical protein
MTQQAHSKAHPTDNIHSAHIKASDLAVLHTPCVYLVIGYYMAPSHPHHRMARMGSFIQCMQLYKHMLMTHAGHSVLALFIGPLALESSHAELSGQPDDLSAVAGPSQLCSSSAPVSAW